MKFVVCLIAGFLMGMALLKGLTATVGFPAGWPIFGAFAVAIGALGIFLERRKN